MCWKRISTNTGLGRFSHYNIIHHSHSRCRQLAGWLSWPATPVPRGILPTPRSVKQVEDAKVGPLASRINNNLNTFVSKSTDPLAETVGNLVTLWDQYKLIYSYPTLKLLPWLLHIIDFYHMDWPRQMWYSDLIKPLVATLCALPDCPDLLFQCQFYHPALWPMALMAWLLELSS